MTKSRLANVFAGVVIAIAIGGEANAIPITGDYTGVWAQGGVFEGLVDMTITTQTSTGVDSFDVEGFFDWLCTVPASVTCFGRELFAGTLQGNVFNVQGFAHVNAQNLLLDTYTAVVSTDGKVFDGTFPNGGTWMVTRVPEPGTLSLLIAGLLGLGVMRRKRVA